MGLLCSCTKLQFICSLSGTVIRNIWMQIAFATVYTAVILILHEYVEFFKFKSTQSTTFTAFGTVTALLLAFRTNTAYDRYWEGRGLWSLVTHNIRQLTRSVWIIGPVANAEDTAEKIAVIHLLVAFPFAVKNYLREDFSYESPDLKELLSGAQSFVSKNGGIGGNGRNSLAKGIPCFNDTKKQCEVTLEPVLLDPVKATSNPGKRLERASRRGTFRAHAEPTETNIPLEILFHFYFYLRKLASKENSISTTFTNQMDDAVTSLSESLSGFERILQTPLPFAYAVHLEHVVWIYLLALPYQLIGPLDWWTIPVMVFGSFCLLGILDIASEIENPFGTDYNDLPLEEICERIKVESFKIVGIPVTGPKARKFSGTNNPSFVMTNCE